MSDYKPNSHKFKERSEEPAELNKPKKVVTGKIRTKEKNAFQKFAGRFIAEDPVNVKAALFEDVLIPSAKKTAREVLTKGIDMLFGFSPSESSSKNSEGRRVSYRKYYEKPEQSSRQGYRNRSVYDYAEVMFDERVDADQVLEAMEDTLAEYDAVSVANFYEFVDLPSNSTDHNYGWQDLRRASVVRVYENGDWKYKIELPRAVPLD